MDTTETQTDEQLVDALFQTNQAEAENEPEAETPSETEPENEPVEDDAPEAEGVEDETEEDGEDDTSEDEDDAEGDDDEAEDPLHDVKVDGQERQVTLQELKNDYAGRASLQTRHEKLRSDETQFSENVRALQQHSENVLRLNQLVQTGQLMAPPAPPDVDEMEDPIGALQADRQYQRDLHQWQSQQAQIQAIEAENQRNAELLQQQELESQKARFAEAFPDVQTDEQRREFGKNLVEGMGKHYGITQEMLAKVTDVEIVKVFHDALRMHDLIDAEKAAKQPREEPRAVTKKRGSRVRPGTKLHREKQMAKALRSQNDDDFIELMFGG